MFRLLLRISLILCCIITFSACTSFRPINTEIPKQELIQKIKIGEEVIIQTKDFTKFKMVVESVTADEIIGKERSVKHDDILVIEQLKIDPIKTTGAAVVIYVGFAMVATLVLLASI